MSNASPILSAGLNLAAGVSKGKGLNTQARNLEYNAKIEKLRGKQTAASHKEELNASLGTIDAIRATRGLGDSIGGRNLRNKNLRNADENLNTAMLNSNLRSDAMLREAKAKKRAAKWALIGGVSAAGNSLVDPVMKMMSQGGK